ncbi:MAG: hypothetical protein C4523_09350 [Myxococcales bacterium]|nr:MAG: hypothetical protein C4523_09350 [Myxococcales bacterium]
MNKRIHHRLAVLALGAALATLMATDAAFAVVTDPTPAQIAAAIARGQTQKDRPEALFVGYEFGQRGHGANGYVMTKLFQVAHRSAMLAQQSKPAEPETMADILKQDYLLFPVYLVAQTAADLEHPLVELRQGVKTLKAAEVLLDPVEKVLCEGDKCLYKRDIYAGFYYRDFKAGQLAVLAIRYGSELAEFPLVLEKIE